MGTVQIQCCLHSIRCAYSCLSDCNLRGSTLQLFLGEDSQTPLYALLLEFTLASLLFQITILPLLRNLLDETLVMHWPQACTLHTFVHDVFRDYPNMDGAFTFIHICIDSS